MKTLIAAVGLLLLSISLHADNVSLNLLWESTTFRRTNTDHAQSVAALHNRTIVGEILGRPADPNTDVAVKGFNATTGDLIWTDEFPGFWVNVEIAHGLAIAVASIPRQVDGSNLLLRGYNAHDGTILWTTQTLHTFSSPQHILLRGNRVAVVGYTESGGPPLNGPLGGFIQVFNAGTGEKLWSTLVSEPAMLPLRDTVFWDVDEAGHHLISLSTVGPGVDRDVVLRSYRFRDGFLEWSVTIPKTFAVNLQISNGEVFVAGFENAPIASYLAAFDVDTGNLRFKASPNPGESITSLNVTDTRIAVGGSGSLRVYDRATKALLFAKFPAPGTEDSIFRALILPFDRILVLSLLNFNPPSPLNQPVIRILDDTGGVLAETFPSTTFADVVISQNRITIAGSSPAGALVRTYGVTLP